MESVDTGVNPIDVCLDWSPFTVYVHDIPLSLQTREMANNIGNKLGQFLDTELYEYGSNWSSDWRLRINLNVSRPLKRAIRLRSAEGEGKLVTFTYEKLPNFCYLCGTLGWQRASNRVRFNNNLPGSYLDLFNSRVRPTFSSPSPPPESTHKSNQIKGVRIFRDFSYPIRGKSAETEQDESSAAESDSNFSKEHRGKGKKYELLKLGEPTVHTKNIDGVSIATQIHFPSAEFGMLGDRSENLIPTYLGLVNSSPEPTIPKAHSPTPNNSHPPPILPNVASYMHAQIVMSILHLISITIALLIPHSYLLVNLTLAPSSTPVLSDPLTQFSWSSDRSAVPPGIISCLSWNCQGLGGPWTIRHLRELVRRHNPPLVFLIETKCHNRKMDDIKKNLAMLGFSVAARGKSGGLPLLWNKEIYVDLVSFSSSHIDARVRLPEESEPWRLTDFYGALNANNRGDSWTLLRRLSQESKLPWMCVGDFNAILSNLEKDGTLPTPQWQLRAFREALTDCDLHDVSFAGFPFTWDNNREYPHTVWKRLYRACVNTIWNQLWLNFHVLHLQRIYFDHAPILVEYTQKEKRRQVWTNKPLRFEAIWIKSEYCEKVISRLWQNTSLGDPNDAFMRKLDTCRMGLISWSKVEFGNDKEN
ncbi:UNVERIFIED_CONTAM: hypothetical protein Sangu_0396000 [Sesamum angustifolium]|uniref:Endonuclease/exonuclease/phosphatase domain-containing protein n=1 Tax=Sesamum angustifolium TaxID=2727405 RepID=A0AAW2QSU6_9LAMI